MFDIFHINKINPLKNKVQLKIENKIKNNDMNNMNSNNEPNSTRKIDVNKNTKKIKKTNPPKRKSFTQSFKFPNNISDTKNVSDTKNNLNKETLNKTIKVKKRIKIRRNSKKRFSLNLDNSVNRINNIVIVKEKEKINPEKTEKNYGIGVGAEKKEEEELDSFELNQLNFKKAINLDKRTFIQMYWSLLRREHPIIFTFFVYDDYNLLYIKIVRFVFLLGTYMIINVFFFSNETFHQLYVDKGKYDFVQQIPQIIYSTIITGLIEILLCCLSLTDKSIYKIKILMLKNLSTKMKSIYKCINIKLIIFFSFTFTLIIFYWYIVAAFCSVYKNTQIIFIKNSIFSFLLGMILPFIIYLIPSSLRKCALKNKNSKTSFYIYKLSKIIPIF